MLSHQNLFVENVRANEVVAFIKADPNFTTVREKINELDKNKDAILLMPSQDDPYVIDIFQRIIHVGTQLMTGNPIFMREDKTWQLKIKLDGQVEVYQSGGTLSNKQLDDFVFKQHARSLIATLKRDGVYRCIADTCCDTVIFTEADYHELEGRRSRDKVEIEIYPSGHFYYVITHTDHTPKRPHKTSTHDVAYLTSPKLKEYHQSVIQPLINNRDHESLRLK